MEVKLSASSSIKIPQADRKALWPGDALTEANERTMELWIMGYMEMVVTDLYKVQNITVSLSFSLWNVETLGRDKYYCFGQIAPPGSE